MRKFLISSTILLCVASSTPAQNSGEAKVYRTQFIELHAKVQAMLVKVESDPQNADIQKEIFALTKLEHRLGEAAGEANAEGLKKGPDKTLLLVVQGCNALDFILSALDSFLDTQDRAFLGFAKDGESLAKGIEKIL